MRKISSFQCILAINHNGATKISIHVYLRKFFKEKLSTLSIGVFKTID